MKEMSFPRLKSEHKVCFKKTSNSLYDNSFRPKQVTSDRLYDNVIQK